MKEIIDAMKANLEELSNDELDAETRSFLASAQAKLAEALIQALKAEDFKEFNQSSKELDARKIWTAYREGMKKDEKSKKSSAI